MRVIKTGGMALILGAAAFTMPADATVQAQTRARVVAPAQRALEVLSIGSGSRIGVSLDDLTADDVKEKKLSSAAGVLIEDVEDGTPASKAGIKTGDVILEFDGERVRSARQLTRLIQETVAGRQVAVVVSRDGQRMNLSVTPESRGNDSNFFATAPEIRIETMPTPMPPRAPRAPAVPRAPLRAPEVWATPTPPAFEVFRDGFAYSFGGGRLGVTTESVSGQFARHFGVDAGALVKNVTEDSAASKAGIRAGDVITKIDGVTIDDSGDLLRALGDKSGEVSVEIVRDRKTQTVKVTLEAARNRTIRRVI